MEDFDFLEEIVNPCVTEKLGTIYQQDEIYQMCIKEEDVIYETLSESLPDEQAEQLESYFTACNATAARKETLTYIQGMKDMLALLKALSK